MYKFCAIVLITLVSTIMLTAEESFAQLYLEKSFNDVELISNIRYGLAININNDKVDLFLDKFTPMGDTISRRPAIILIHGGAFVAGGKESGFIVDLCTSFAKKGYVTFSINYRLDKSINSRAIVNAAEDARAAVRFIKKNSNVYGIDTNRIAIGGESAGAYTALAATYSDKAFETDNLDTSKSCRENLEFGANVQACIDISGALADVAHIEGANDPPLLIFHGTNDEIIDYKSAVNLFNQAEKVGLYNEFYPVIGAGHNLTGKFNFIDSLTSAFLYKVFFKSYNFEKSPAVELTQNYPNPTTSMTKLNISLPYTNIVNIDLYDVSGRLIDDILYREMRKCVYEIDYNAGALSPGIYYIVLKFDYTTITRKIVVVK